MPWQRYVADVALEINPETGRLVYREVGLTVPRQSGKTTLILTLAVHRALNGRERQRIVYAAQTRNDALKKWEDDHVVALEASQFSPLFRVRRKTGNEAIIWKNGSMHGITSNTEKAGHGPTIDLAFVDEAFAQVDDRLEQAFKPSMITRPQPQLWVVSTAGKPDSAYLKAKVDAGRKRAEDGLTERAAYFEWSAPEDADPGNRQVWHDCMPALCPAPVGPGLECRCSPDWRHTITEVAVAADFSNFQETNRLIEFQRAYLNQWRTKNVHVPVIADTVWSGLADVDSVAEDPLAFAVDVTPERSKATIASAGRREDGKWHAEVVDHREGTGWLLARVLQLNARWNPAAWVLDPSGPAGSLIPDLQKNGIDPVLVNGREMAQACGAIYDDWCNGNFVHLDQVELNTAVSGAKWRPLGDARAWHRKDSATDISPLVAVTLARHGIATYEPEEDLIPWAEWG